MEYAAFAQRLAGLSQHVHTLHQRLRAHPASRDLAVDDLLENLHSTLEELHMASAELRPQNEAVAVVHAETVTIPEQTAAQLHASEATLRLFVNQLPAAVAMFDCSMRYLAVSQRWMQDYGLRDAILGRSHYEVFPEIPEHWKAVHRRYLPGCGRVCGAMPPTGVAR